MAEHKNESTLSFYATNFMEDIIGPGIGRAYYGGCMLVFPPIWIPDVWEDMRFERAKTPSERLLLAAIYHSSDYFVVHVAKKRIDMVGKYLHVGESQNRIDAASKTKSAFRSSRALTKTFVAAGVAVGMTILTLVAGDA